MSVKTLLYFLGFVSLFACGKIRSDGNLAQRDFPLQGEIQTLDATGKFRLFYSPTVKKPFLALEGSENILNNLNIRQEGSTLKITENRAVEGTDLYHLTLYTRKIPSRVILKDSVEYNLFGSQPQENLTLKAEGFSKVLGDVSAKNIVLDLSNHARINLTGYTSEARIAAKEQASVVSPYWFIERLEVNAQDSVYLETNPQSSIEGKATGTSVLRYFGNPKLLLKTSGKAQLKKQAIN